MAQGVLLFRGRRVSVDGAASIGRRAENDIVIESEAASRHHARVERQGDEYRLIDAGSVNGTYLNGERLQGTERTLEDGDTIAVGGETLRFLVEGARPAARGLDAGGAGEPVALPAGHLRIGRDPTNDIVLGDPSVSRFHAEVQSLDGQARLRDLGSTNGTRVNGHLVDSAMLAVGSEVGIGSHRLIFDGRSFVTRDDHGGLRIDAERLHKMVGEQQILSDVSLSIGPGELVAITGESGAGKTTLLKALAGADEPSLGLVTVNGDPVRTRLTDLGYVPQDEIVHRRLTVSEALAFAARLRLPEDSKPADIEAAVWRVLQELDLAEHAAKRVDQLSGGQRKRISVAIELLNRPGLLFLDEPTTGLDPGLEARSMHLFRRLADNQRAVILVTHATRSLELCDRLIVMGRGGVLTFDGTPRDALDFFGVAHYDEIYRELDGRAPQPWRADPGQAAGRDETMTMLPQAHAGEVRLPRRRLFPQVVLLIERYARLLWRDRRNLLILTLQVPVLALAVVALFRGGVFERPGGRSQQAIQLLFLVATTAIWFGAIDAAREIIKERSVLERERAAGLRLSSYLASKVVLLLSLATGQTFVMAAIVFAFHPLHEPAAAGLGVLAIVIAGSWVAVGMGLAISASVSTEDQATSFIPLALLPQLLFAGAVVPTAAMGRAAELLSNVMFARWAVAGTGSQIDMNARIAADPAFARISRYSESFFDVSFGAAVGILAAFLALMLGVTWLQLWRQPR